jgi:CTP:molybdopterin cytidylyltransferase MocA
VVLAAAGARRYGGPKALVRHEGQPLVERALATLRAAGCAPLLVVLGAEAARVRAEADLSGAMTVEDGGWRTGSASALKAALAALADTDAEVAVVLPVDAPGVCAEAVRRVAAGAGRDSLSAATYKERRGHPVLLGRDHWAGVSVIATGDVGARAYLTARAASVRWVACEDVADDAELEVPAGDG